MGDRGRGACEAAGLGPGQVRELCTMLLFVFLLAKEEKKYLRKLWPCAAFGGLWQPKGGTCEAARSHRGRSGGTVARRIGLSTPNARNDTRAPTRAPTHTTG